MSNIYFYIVPAITGSLIACLGPINGTLQARSGVWGMALIVHVLGITVAGLGYLGTKSDGPVYFVGNIEIRTWVVPLITAVAAALSAGAVWRGTQGGLPVFSFLGGVFGVLIVIGTVYSVDRLGVLVSITLIMAFEILMASAIDHFGLFNRNRIPMSPQRIASLAFIVVGIFLNVRSK